MYFPPSQECTSSMGSGKSIKSARGSNQPQALSIVYPVATSRETTPQPKASKPREKPGGKSKKKQASAQPNSPSMFTRSKTRSPAQGTRSKRKILD